jgi:peroxiredoxin
MIEPGTEAPDFTLLDQEGEPVSLILCVTEAIYDDSLHGGIE